MMRERLVQPDHDDKALRQKVDTQAAPEAAFLPKGPGSQVRRQAYVLQMQRQRGNNYVRRMLASKGIVQRQRPFGRDAPAADTAVEEPGAAQNEITDGSASVRVESGNVVVDAASMA